MNQQSYAELQDLADYLGVAVGTLTATDRRYLYRASELIHSITNGQFSYDSRASQTEPYPSILRAVCAQVEYWRANGEGVETDIPTRGFSIGKYSAQYAGGSRPQRLCPRALDALSDGGALYTGVEAW
jgi:hypothetical protein